MERLNKRQLDDFSDDVIEKVIPKKKKDLNIYVCTQ